MVGTGLAGCAYGHPRVRHDDGHLLDALNDGCDHILAGTADPVITMAARQSPVTPHGTGSAASPLRRPMHHEHFKLFWRLGG